MGQVKDFHDRAMDLSDRAFRERASGDVPASLRYFEQALQFELSAIAAMEASEGLLWSILHRSAAALALDCGNFRESERMASAALAGEPPPEIVEEIRGFLERIYSRRHLELRGIPLQGFGPLRDHGVVARFMLQDGYHVLEDIWLDEDDE